MSSTQSSSLVDSLPEMLRWVGELPTWQSLLIIFTTSLLFGKVIGMVSTGYLHRATEDEGNGVAANIIRHIELPIYITTAAIGAYLSMAALSINVGGDNVQGMVLSVLIVVWGYAISRASREVGTVVSKHDQVDNDVVPILQNVWTFFIIVAVGFSILSLWNVDVTPLLASAGVLGVALGFAAKDTVANFFGGIALYVDGTYSVGDFIVLESGERGKVETISIRSTQLRTHGGKLLTVPNAMLNSGKVLNESRADQKHVVEVPIGVGYSSDVEKVEELLISIGKDHDAVETYPTPKVYFREYGDSALKFKLLVWVNKHVQYARIVDDLNHDIYTRFDEEGIEIPFPQRVISVNSDSTEIEE